MEIPSNKFENVMAALAAKQHFDADVCGQESTVLQSDLIPVPPELRAFLLQAYGVESHMIAYFSREEPNRIYVNAYGQFYFIDLPVMVNAANDISVQACELAQNYPDMRNDLERELSEALQLVLSRLPEKHDEAVVAPASESPKYKRSSALQTVTNIEREELRRGLRRRNVYKTSLCRSFRENNACPYGEACAFAHGERELRLPPQAHPKYKTQLCNKFSVWNYCPYGARCQYIHQCTNGTAKIAANIQKKRYPGRNIKKDSPYVISSNHLKLNLRRINRSGAYSPNAPGYHSLFAKKDDFSSLSLSTTTSSSHARNQGQSTETACFFDPNGVGYENQSHHDVQTVANNTFNQLSERFSNMKIEDKNSMFSRSCFPRIGTK